MGDKSSIEWTDATWNPVRGCSIVSKGCTNCYAMRQAHRHNHPGGAYEGLTMMSKAGPVWNGEIRAVPELLEQPVKWKQPRRIFVNSMSDLFHEDVHGDFIDAVLSVIKRCNQLGRGHKFQLLTKRAERMHRFMRHYGAIENLWLGVSVEDQASAVARIPFLMQTPAAVRWISAEPLLGPIDLHPFLTPPANGGAWKILDWVVTGGESGPGARPMHPDWVRALRDHCSEHGIAFFFKQWGSHLPGEYDPKTDVSIRWQDGRTEWYGDHADIKYTDRWVGEGDAAFIAWPTSKGKAGRHLDGRVHDEYPA